MSKSTTAAERAAEKIVRAGIIPPGQLVAIIAKEYEPMLRLALHRLERLQAEETGPCPACERLRQELGR